MDRFCDPVAAPKSRAADGNGKDVSIPSCALTGGLLLLVAPSACFPQDVVNEGYEAYAPRADGNGRGFGTPQGCQPRPLNAPPASNEHVEMS